MLLMIITMIPRVQSTQSVYVNQVGDWIVYNTTFSATTTYPNGSYIKAVLIEKNITEVVGTSGTWALGEVMWVEIFNNSIENREYDLMFEGWQSVYNISNANLSAHDYLMMNGSLSFGITNLSRMKNATVQNFILELGVPINQRVDNGTYGMTIWVGFSNGNGSSLYAPRGYFRFDPVTNTIMQATAWIWDGSSWIMLLDSTAIDWSWKETLQPLYYEILAIIIIISLSTIYIAIVIISTWKILDMKD